MSFSVRFPIGALCVVMAAATAPAVSQSVPRDTFHLAEIVVTPMPVATPRSSVAAAVTVLDGERLRADGITTVADALREVPGAAVVQPGSEGALTALFLRGGESDYTAVLVDGVPLNDPGGAINLADLTLDNVDRIEVVRGPASVLYGSDAVSGVVQIFTRRGHGPARVEAGAEAGWFDGLTPGGATVAASGFRKSLERWQAGVSGGSDVVAYSLALSREGTGGLYGTPAFDNSYRNAVVSGLLRAQPDARTDLSFMARYGDHLFHYPTDGAGRLADANQYDHGTSTALGLDVGRLLLPGLEARLRLADYRTDGGTEDAPDSAADTLGFYAYHSLSTVERRRGDAQAHWRTSRAVLTAGGMVEGESEQSASESQSSFGNASDQLDVHRSNHAAYVQIQGDPAGMLSVNAGARWDGSGTYGDFFTYRGGLVVRPLPNLRLRASAGTGFKEPTFYQNFATGFARGNPNLKPERSVSWEVGLEQSAWNGRAHLAATYFDQRFRDLIDFTFAPPLPTDPNYFNIASARARGLELEASLAPAARVALEGQATWLSTRVVEGGFDSGPGALLEPDSALLRRPAFTIAGNLRHIVSSRVRATLSARQVGARADLDYTGYPPGRVTLPAYGTASLSVEGDVLKAADRTVTVTARLENAFDTPYQEAVNFPARRRTVWLGARARF